MIAIKHILCPVDFSDFSRHALDYAVAIAAWYDSRVSALHVFTSWPAADVIPSLGTLGTHPISLEEVGRDAILEHLSRFVAREGAAGVTIEPVIAEAPNVHREILGRAESLGADLIVLGSHGRSGFERLLLGSITDKVLRKAACPVLVVPRHVGEGVPSEAVHFKRILCPVDFSEGSITGLTWAMSLAEEAGGHLTALHVVEIPAGLYEPSTTVDVAEFRAIAEAASLARLRDLIPDSVREYCDVETVVAGGSAAREILRLAAEQQSDLIVMGVQGRGAVDLTLFGSNTHRVIQSATCPVMTLR